jgi:hypothetical protein
MRINARLDQESEQYLRYLQEVTGKSCTEIVKESLTRYYHSVAGDSQRKNKQLVEELAGIAVGPSDGSVNYKEYVKDYVSVKHGHR